VVDDRSPSETAGHHEFVISEMALRSGTKESTSDNNVANCDVAAEPNSATPSTTAASPTRNLDTSLTADSDAAVSASLSGHDTLRDVNHRDSSSHNYNFFDELDARLTHLRAPQASAD
jgi:hypothetical protein